MIFGGQGRCALRFIEASCLCVEVGWIWCQNFVQVELQFRSNLARVNLGWQGLNGVEYRQAFLCHVYVLESYER